MRPTVVAVGEHHRRLGGQLGQRAAMRSTVLPSETVLHQDRVDGLRHATMRPTVVAVGESRCTGMCSRR
jgi:hypothetical protein